MGYAVVGYFDQNSDEKIRLLWRELADLGISDYLIQSENSPHFKFAIYETIDLDSAQKALCLLGERLKKINIHFKSYSFYPNEKPFINIDIAVSMPVLELQAEIQRTLDEFGKKVPVPYFDTGIWKPDCQLTIGIEKERLSKAVNFLSETELPFDGVLEKIGIIEFHPAKKLYTFPLS